MHHYVLIYVKFTVQQVFGGHRIQKLCASVRMYRLHQYMC